MFDDEFEAFEEVEACLGLRKRIKELRHESACAGDETQVHLCTLALGGDQNALNECKQVLDDWDRE